MKNQISIIITTLNDNHDCEQTVRSLLDTCHTEPEIIVIDDGSTEPFKPSDDIKDYIRLIRLTNRIGVGPARHYGATIARFKYLFITDSHMRFNDGWDKQALEHLEAHPNSLYCTTCVGLSKENMDMENARGSYHGAGINFFGTDPRDPNKWQIIEGTWLKEIEKKDDYVIPCVMGANYFIEREFFFFIGGLKMLRHYGSDEPYLSLKTWMAGGEVRLMKDVEVGHQFRQETHYRNGNSEMCYNKLMMATTLLPEKAAAYINDQLLMVYKAGDVNMARRLWKLDERLIQAEAAWMHEITRFPLIEFLKRFDIPVFWG